MMGGFGFVFWLVILIGVIGLVWFFASLPKHGTHRSTARVLLEERYACGEIDREEYLEKKRDL